jgi:hypothetical protein
MVNAALQDAAAVTVSANFNAIVPDRIEYELGVNRSELVQALLNDMIAVEILDEVHDAEPKRLDDEMNLLGNADILNHLLESAGPVLVESNPNHVLRSVLYQNGSLVVVAELEELLAQIITKWIHHELDNMLVCLEPNHMHLLRIALLKLFLKIAATMLILAEVINLTTE